MSKRGKPGRGKWIISEWLDADSDDFWLTIIAIAGWFMAHPLLAAMGTPAASLPLAEAKEIGSTLGHTVNDMFLAICASALRRYLAEKNMTPDLPLTATVPVSIQLEGANKKGNQITYIAVNLCTDVDDPLEREQFAEIDLGQDDA